MASPEARPLVSVVIPTHRRPDLLRRAVESVLAQTLGDFELIVSDDESSPGEGWREAQSLARRDGRIRAVRLEGPPGQCANLNHAMSLARAPWIKPLHDDDALHRHCLARMVAAAQRQPGAAALCCLAAHYVRGRLRRIDSRGTRAPVERLAGRDAQRAMCLQDLDIGPPSQLLVRASAVRAGAWMESPPGIEIAVDTWWAARLLQRGDLVLVNEPLVDLHQGDHDTVTSRATDDALYREFHRLRDLLEAPSAGGAAAARLRAAHQHLELLRALRELRAGRPLSAIKRAASVDDRAAWRLFGVWSLRRLFPGRFELFPREPVMLDAPGPDPARAKVAFR